MLRLHWIFAITVCTWCSTTDVVFASTSCTITLKGSRVAGTTAEEASVACTGERLTMTLGEEWRGIASLTGNPADCT